MQKPQFLPRQIEAIGTAIAAARQAVGTGGQLGLKEIEDSLQTLCQDMSERPAGEARANAAAVAALVLELDHLASAIAAQKLILEARLDALLVNEPDAS